MHHLFALLRTLRIKQENGLDFSTVSSISPLPTIRDYSSALSDFHAVSRATGPKSQERKRNSCNRWLDQTRSFSALRNSAKVELGCLPSEPKNWFSQENRFESEHGTPQVHVA